MAHILSFGLDPNKIKDFPKVTDSNNDICEGTSFSENTFVTTPCVKYTSIHFVAEKAMVQVDYVTYPRTQRYVLFQ